MQKDKIKVAWICEFSNKEIREKLHYEKYTLLSIARQILKKNSLLNDYNNHITNAIKEFETFENIELHIISHHQHLKKRKESFTLKNIHYHFYKKEDDNLISKIKNLFPSNFQKTTYHKNNRIINNFIETINPDIVHLIGAENPHYASSVLSLDKRFPLLVSLQTLMSDPLFFNNYPITQQEYEHRSNIEREIIKKATYICTVSKKFQSIILERIYSKAVFLKMKLAVGQNAIYTTNISKTFDFVYFAMDISKASDYAIEAFALAQKKYKKITLNIVGGYNNEYKRNIDKRINELGISKSVTFSGKLPLQTDVISQIQKSKFALLPLKIDVISGTIREAIACGLPVITTITSGTPLLNNKRESVLLSPIGDHQSMANNMIKLIENKDLIRQLILNAKITLDERYDNKKSMMEWVNIYKAVYDNINYNRPIPKELFT